MSEHIRYIIWSDVDHKVWLNIWDEMEPTSNIESEIWDAIWRNIGPGTPANWGRTIEQYQKSL